MKDEVSTCNLAEALYLLQHGSRIVNVYMASNWPALLLEGKTAQEDHLRYVARKVDVDLSALSKLFAAITAVLEKGGQA